MILGSVQYESNKGMSVQVYSNYAGHKDQWPSIQIVLATMPK